jgi:hypothetical protein
LRPPLLDEDFGGWRAYFFLAFFVAFLGAAFLVFFIGMGLVIPPLISK